MSLARNTSLNLLSAVVLVGIAVVTVPLYLRLIGLERYGVLSICWLLLGYLGLFDLGLGRAVTQAVAALASERSNETGRIFWTAWFGSLCLGAAAFLIALPAGHLAMNMIRFQNVALQREALAAVPWIACAVPLNMVAGISAGLLVGQRRFATTNAIDIGSSLAATLAPLGAAALGYTSLPVLVATSVVARAVSGLVTFGVAVLVAGVSTPVRPDRGRLRALLAFGGWVSLSNVVGPILSLWDRFIIGVLLGPAAVSLYVVPFSVIMRLLVVPESLNRALFPQFAGMNRDDAAALCTAVAGFMSLIMTPLMLAALLIFYPFLHIWIGPSLAVQTIPVVYCLVPGIWINAQSLIAFALLHAQRRADISAIIHAAQVVPYVALLWVAIRLGGVAGAAALWTFRTAIDAWLMFRLSSVGTAPLRATLAPFAVVVAASLYALAVSPASTAQWAVLATAGVAGTLLAYATAPPMARQRLTALLATAKRRIRTTAAD